MAHRGSISSHPLWIGGNLLGTTSMKGWIYTYQCPKCRDVTHCLVQQEGTVPFVDRCRSCGSITVRIKISKAILFKGKIQYKYIIPSELQIKMASPEKRREYKKGLMVRVKYKHHEDTDPVKKPRTV